MASVCFSRCVFKISLTYQDMIEKLNAEAGNDATEKAFCDKELGETNEKKTTQEIAISYKCCAQSMRGGTRVATRSGLAQQDGKGQSGSEYRQT